MTDLLKTIDKRIADANSLLPITIGTLMHAAAKRELIALAALREAVVGLGEVREHHVSRNNVVGRPVQESRTIALIDRHLAAIAARLEQP